MMRPEENERPDEANLADSDWRIEATSVNPHRLILTGWSDKGSVGPLMKASRGLALEWNSY